VRICIPIVDVTLPSTKLRTSGLRSAAKESERRDKVVKDTRSSASNRRRLGAAACQTSVMISYAHGASPVPLLGETIGENVRRSAERFPENEALVVRQQGYRATYRQLWEQTTELGRALIARGVAAGDRVGIWAPNRFEWVVLQYATARIGAILVNINPAYKTAELEYALNQSGASLLFLARAFPQSA